jgi:hypothetical protein
MRESRLFRRASEYTKRRDHAHLCVPLEKRCDANAYLSVDIEVKLHSGVQIRQARADMRGVRARLVLGKQPPGDTHRTWKATSVIHGHRTCNIEMADNPFPAHALK